MRLSVLFPNGSGSFGCWEPSPCFLSAYDKNSIKGDGATFTAIRNVEAFGFIFLSLWGFLTTLTFLLFSAFPHLQFFFPLFLLLKEERRTFKIQFFLF